MLFKAKVVGVLSVNAVSKFTSLLTASTIASVLFLVPAFKLSTISLVYACLFATELSEVIDRASLVDDVPVELFDCVVASDGLASELSNLLDVVS
ncbi:Uncharacterised protein [Staphylococcus aureus]|nr:Uncharacterised protein [Staphylococcus aureus]SCS91914.1 Uncharacterised protein [Staphylococcus aureus]